MSLEKTKTAVAVHEIFEDVEEGMILTKYVVLSCGHKIQVNPIFSYRKGELHRCMVCHRMELK